MFISVVFNDVLWPNQENRIRKIAKKWTMMF
jgi:hypothetical protein